MTLQPLLSAPLAVQIHVFTVVPAALIGAFLLAGRKGTRLHRLAGRVWIALMAGTSISTFFIHELDLFFGFSPIHVLSAATLFGCYGAVRMARAGRIDRHRAIVKSLYFGAIGIAGLFALLPGRIMNRVVFGPDAATMLALILLAALAAAAVAAWFFYPRPAGARRVGGGRADPPKPAGLTAAVERDRDLRH